MKECNKCEFFEGYDCDDGTPICSYANGETCPHNDMEGIKQVDASTGLKIVIDGERISEYIRETICNTVYGRATEIAENHVKQIVEEAYKENIQSLTLSAIKSVVDKQVDEFMQGDVTVGGGWSEPARTLSRTAYLNEIIQKELSKKLDENGVKKEAERIASSVTDNFLRDMRNRINSGLKQYFDDATRQVLTDNVVSMLMCNETYRRLSESMGHLLGAAGE